jgi:hypothetical protein
MPHYTVLVLEDKPGISDESYHQVIDNPEYPAALRLRVSADDEFAAVINLGKNLE